MKQLIYVLIILGLGLGIISCRKKGCTDSKALNFDSKASKNDGSCVYDSSVFGEVTVDMTAEKPEVRTRETLLGNFVSDAMYHYAVNDGKDIDFALENGGNIRFDPNTRPDGIYPAGEWDESMVNELLPFSNTLTYVTVTGKELKDIMEHSVSSLPQAKGHFMQLSSQINIVVDTTRTSEEIDDVTDPDNPQIIVDGDRIISISINGISYDTLASYTFITNSYIAEGNDGYITLGNVAASYKVSTSVNTTEAVKTYLQTKERVTPMLDGRISFQ